MCHSGGGFVSSASTACRLRRLESVSIEKDHDESATKFIACFTVQSFVHAKSPTTSSIYHLEHRVGSKKLGRGPTEHEERVVDTGSAGTAKTMV